MPALHLTDYPLTESVLFLLALRKGPFWEPPFLEDGTRRDARVRPSDVPAGRRRQRLRQKFEKILFFEEKIPPPGGLLFFKKKVCFQTFWQGSFQNLEPFPFKTEQLTLEIAHPKV